MIVQKRSSGGGTVLVVEGVVKLGQSARFFAEALSRALDQKTGHVIIDLEKIDTIDSTGIGELLGHLVRFQEQKRKLILVRPPQRVRRLLEVADVLPMFPIFDDVESALALDR